MNDQLLATLIGVVLCGGLGLLVPRLVARVPEPPPQEPAPQEQDGTPEPVDPAEPPVPAEAEGQDEEAPKVAYADIAASEGLALRSAAIAAVSGALLGWATGLDWPLVWLLPLVPVAVALSVIDWHTRLLPRILVLPATLAAIVVVVVVGLAAGEGDAVVRALVGMLAVRSFFWLLWFVRSAGMGFGDVRLAALVGLVLGWAGWGALAIGVWVGFLIFALPGVTLALIKRDRRLMRKPFPYGPFMVVGALVGLVWGPRIAVALWG